MQTDVSIQGDSLSLLLMNNKLPGLKDLGVMWSCYQFILLSPNLGDQQWGWEMGIRAKIWTIAPLRITTPNPGCLILLQALTGSLIISNKLFWLGLGRKSIPNEAFNPIALGSLSGRLALAFCHHVITLVFSGPWGSCDSWSIREEREGKWKGYTGSQDTQLTSTEA